MDAQAQSPVSSPSHSPTSPGVPATASVVSGTGVAGVPSTGSGASGSAGDDTLPGAASLVSPIAYNGRRGVVRGGSSSNGNAGAPAVKIPRDARPAFSRASSGSTRNGGDLLSPATILATPSAAGVAGSGATAGQVVPLVVALAGSGTQGCTDGFATTASFDRPAHIALDPSNGDLYVTEYNNNAIRVRTARGRGVERSRGGGCIVGLTRAVRVACSSQFRALKHSVVRAVVACCKHPCLTVATVKLSMSAWTMGLCVVPHRRC